MQVAISSLENKKGKDTLEVSDTVFGQEFNEPLIHQVMNAYLAGARAGTRGQKTRTEVRGGGIKPWRQKGTGRARAGSIRSPIWRGGGKVFAAKTQDHSQKVNKKMYRGAVRSILSELIRQNRLIIVENFEMIQPKTRDLVSKLKSFAMEEALIVTEQSDRMLDLAARNLPYVGVTQASLVDPYALVRFDKVLMTVPALRKLEEALK